MQAATLNASSSLSPVPFYAPGASSAPISAPAPTIGRVLLWQLIVAQLDIAQLGFSTNEIAQLFGLQAQSVRKWCLKLFPRLDEKRRVYWLAFEEAVWLIFKICQEGRKLPAVPELYAQLIERGVITPNFPADSSAVRAADKVFAARRARVLQGIQ